MLGQVLVMSVSELQVDANPPISTETVRPASCGFCTVCGDGERDLRLVRADLNKRSDVFVIPNTNTSELGEEVLNIFVSEAIQNI